MIRLVERCISVFIIYLLVSSIASISIAYAYLVLSYSTFNVVIFLKRDLSVSRSSGTRIRGTAIQIYFLSNHSQ